ncbi:MAG: glycosyltransferase family 9 protein [Cytophagia bacterium]|nr:glycosyltransferase family 9 protein [Cytophagia bacterium]
MSNKPSKKILFIRLQAIGDSIITYPYIREFVDRNPDFEVHFLTRSYASGIPQHLKFFNRVWILKGKKRPVHRLPFTLLMLPFLRLQQYDIVCDLQNNRESRLIRRLLFPKKHSSFDAYSPIPAGERVYNAINNLGLNYSRPNFRRYNINIEPCIKLDENVLKVVVNPAGYFSSRNWPHDHYIEWAKEVLEYSRKKIQFVLIGIDRVEAFAKAFELEFPEHTLNLVNKTSLSQAFALIQKMDFVLSEDSGLMHMAWVSGVKTLAIFGSTRSDWSRPLGDHTMFLDSSDMECGNCMLATCKFGDNRCLTRYSSKLVFKKTLELLND